MTEQTLIKFDITFRPSRRSAHKMRWERFAQTLELAETSARHALRSEYPRYELISVVPSVVAAVRRELGTLAELSQTDHNKQNTARRIMGILADQQLDIPSYNALCGRVLSEPQLSNAILIADFFETYS